MLVRALRTFGEALALARGGGNARLELETALLRFIIAGEDPSLDSLRARLAALEEKAGASAPPATNQPSIAAKPAEAGQTPKHRLQRLASKGASRLAEHSI